MWYLAENTVSDSLLLLNIISQVKRQGNLFLQWTRFCPVLHRSASDTRTGRYVPCEVHHLPVPAHALRNDSYKTRNFMPYFSGKVCGFFKVPDWTYEHGRYCKTGPTVYSPYSRRLGRLTICGCNCKGSTFSSVILGLSVVIRPGSNSRPSAWQPDAQATKPPLRWGSFETARNQCY